MITYMTWLYNMSKIEKQSFGWNEEMNEEKFQIKSSECLQRLRGLTQDTRIRSK